MRSLSNSPGTRNLARALALSALLIGCGDDGDDDDAPESPVAKCQKLSSTYCTRQAVCWRQANNGSEGEERSARDVCQAKFVADAMCSRAIDVTPTFGQCLQLLPMGTCAEFLSETGYVPSACSKVIIYPPNDAGT